MYCNGKRLIFLDLHLFRPFCQILETLVARVSKSFPTPALLTAALMSRCRLPTGELMGKPVQGTQKL